MGQEVNKTSNGVFGWQTLNNVSPLDRMQSFWNPQHPWAMYIIIDLTHQNCSLDTLILFEVIEWLRA